MGADQSTFRSTYNQPLHPQGIPICATEPRFCLPHTVKLRLRENFFSYSGDDFQITDAANTSIVYFQCDGDSFSLRQKKILRDNMGMPVLNMKDKILSFPMKFRVFAGEGSEREICIINSKMSMNAKLFTMFPDVLNGATRHLVLKGDWTDKRCIIYMGEPKQGGIPIARIFKPLNERSFLGVDDYFMEIAAGVDIAICVIMCIALDEHSHDRDRNLNQ